MNELVYLQIKHAYTTIIQRPIHLNDDVLKFLQTYVLYSEPTTLFSEKYIEALGNAVFQNANVMRFVLDVSANFHIHFNLSGQSPEKLANYIADAISLETPETGMSKNDKCLVPNELRKRVLNNIDITQLLSSNKWLITVILLNLLDIKIEEDQWPR